MGPGDHESEKSSLWVASILGDASPRRLRGEAFHAELSPDGALFVFGNDDGLRIAGSDGEDPRDFLTEADDESFGAAQWSWEGKRIVYSRWDRVGKRWKHAIESRDLEGGAPQTLARGRRIDSFLMLEDRMVFDMNEPFPRQRDENLWEVAVDPATGAPRGEPRRLTDWTGFTFADLSATRDGRVLAFRKSRRQADVYVAELEDGGARLSGQRRLSLDQLDDYPSVWTPDSAALVYHSNRNGTRDLFRQGLDERTATVLTSSPRNLGGTRLTPDGAWYLFWSIAREPDDEPEEDQPEEPRRLMRIPVAGGPAELVLETTAWTGLHCARTPGGGCVLSEGDPETRRQTFSRLDPLAGKGEELFGMDFDRDTSPRWDLSPDGRRIALVGSEEDDRSIGVHDLAGNLLEEVVLQALPGAWLSDVAWPGQASGFFFIAGSPRGDILGFVEPTGRAQVYQQARAGGFSDPRPSHDGRRLAYAVSTQESNVWMIEEF